VMETDQGCATTSMLLFGLAVNSFKLLLNLWFEYIILHAHRHFKRDSEAAQSGVAGLRDGEMYTEI